MHFVCLHDKEEIERHLRNNVFLNLYSIGDLDDFFWPHTLWYALTEGADLGALALLYVGQPLPTLLALSEATAVASALLEAIRHLLPQRFYAHLSPGLESAFGVAYKIEGHGEHYKMALGDTAAVAGYDSSGVVPLGKAHGAEVLEFYQEGYPGNWFDPRMLETNQYFGIREEGRLVSVAGIHVYSPRYRVAALGNIATLPAWRNRGYGRRVTAGLCRSLAAVVDHIGLNVKADNDAAIVCYRKLGFQVVASYGEFIVEK